MQQLENKINSLRRNISQMTVLLECKKCNIFTKHQQNLRLKFSKKYGNTKTENLTYHLTLLKQDLKATSDKMKYQKKWYERKLINRKFATDAKQLYRTMKGKQINLENIPEKENVETFWKSIWGDSIEFDSQCTWVKELKQSYC